MRSFLRFALLALMLLVVALVSALTAMRFAIHTSEVVVPNLVGKTPVEGRKLAEDNGLQMEVERRYYSPTTPEGKILSQLPPASTQVRRGWQVRVALSLGPQRVEIPSLLGQSQRAAEINIRRRGLDLGAVAQLQIPGAPSDQVLSQSPLPNASGVSAPKISLLVTLASQPAQFCWTVASRCRATIAGGRIARRSRDFCRSARQPILASTDYDTAGIRQQLDRVT